MAAPGVALAAAVEVTDNFTMEMTLIILMEAFRTLRKIVGLVNGDCSGAALAVPFNDVIDKKNKEKKEE